LSPHAITIPARPVGTTVPSTAQDPKLRVDLLGPVVVTYGDADVMLSPLELNLLVILALTPGVAVSTERLIDDLWGSRLPAAPRSRVQGLVSGLRRKVGDAVQTRYPGYVIDPARLERDIDECERLVSAARETTSTAERLRMLAAAQEVWRGEPLVGVATPGVAPERTRLCEQRLGLLVARGEAELEAGRHRDLVGLLAPAVAEHPLAEQLAGLYITALYRSNRQADALAAYQGLRERLADELGADACAELQELHAQILRGEGFPAEPVAAYAEPVEPRYPSPPPAQLPAPDGLFLGREAELLDLDSPDGHVVVSAPGGLGKTALVVEWAHRVAPEYPDGQLFLDLGRGRAPEDVVGAALVALGVPTAGLPATLGDRVGLYRTVAHDRRLLVVADDAESVEQVLAVVPPGPGSRLVVTTRRRLVTLSAHHCVREVVLGPLDAPSATELLHRVVGSGRLAGQDTTGLVTWCGGWPLLLRHAAAKLAMRPSQSVSAYVAELERHAPAVVLGDDPRSVDDALGTAYDVLTPDAARLFERLGLLTGEFCLHLAAAAAGTTGHRVRILLDELVGTHLVVEGGSGRFRYHEVVGRYARRLASQQEWTLAGWGAVDCLECSLPSIPAPLVAVPVPETVPV
jgi:DNA-binding SARP family transcriptional activator